MDARSAQLERSPCYILPMFYLFIFLWPSYAPALMNGGSRKFYTWWTLSVNREVTTSTGWAKKWRNLAYFQIPPANFLLSRPNAAEYCNSEKSLIVKHRWLLYTCATVSWTLAYKPLRSTRHIIVLKKLIGWDMFYFYSLVGSTVGTSKRLCVFRRRTRTRTLCIRLTLCRHVTIGTPMVTFAVLTVFWLFLVHCWYTVGTVLVDMWRLVHQWSFLLFWLSFDCFWLFLAIGTLLVQSW